MPSCLGHSQCPAMSPNGQLDVSLPAILDEVKVWIGRQSKADCLQYHSWVSFSQLKVWMEPEPHLLWARASLQVSSLLVLLKPQLGFASHYYTVTHFLNNKSFPKYLHVQLFLFLWRALANRVFSSSCVLQAALGFNPFLLCIVLCGFHSSLMIQWCSCIRWTAKR